MKQRVSFEQSVFTHAGVAVDHYASEIDLSFVDEATRTAMMQMGGGKSDLYTAVVDHYTIMTMADPEGTAMRKLIDAADTGDLGGPGGTGFDTALARSMFHKESLLFFMDLTKLTGQGMPPGAPSTVSFGLGEKDGALVTRITVSK